MSYPSGGQGSGDGRPDGRSGRHPAAEAAHRLSGALERHGITTEVSEGAGVALVSVHIDLVTWTDGSWYFWWSGAMSEITGRRTYDYSPADDPVTTARRVAVRYEQLRRAPRPLTGTSAVEVPAPRTPRSASPRPETQTPHDDVEAR